MDPAKYQATLIQTSLKLQGSSQAVIARELNISPATVHEVVYGRTRSRRVEMRIAAVTGRPLAELWPQWHGPKKSRSRALTRDQLADALRALCG